MWLDHNRIGRGRIAAAQTPAAGGAVAAGTAAVLFPGGTGVDPAVLFTVREAQSYQYEAHLVDGFGLPVPPATLTRLVLTLTRADCCPPDGVPIIVNDRDHQDVLSGATPDVLVNPQGLLTWVLSPADVTIGPPVRRYARHRAAFEFAVVGAAGRHAIYFDIEGGG
jgi:hypothetical protein